MQNQARHSIREASESENRSFRYTSDDKIKSMKFVKNVFNGYEIKPLKSDYFGYKFEVICSNGDVLEKFYTKLNAKKAIFEHLENN